MSAPAKEYDYIVAGACSAGCALAARLAEDPDARVLLVEAGGNGRSLFVTMPAGNGFLFGNPKYDWGFQSAPQPELNGRQIYYPRGRGVGGTSLLNGMIYIRGNARDYDRWRQSGLEGWGYADLLPYFRRAEAAPHRDDPYHGRSGPLRTSPTGNYCEIDRMFITAACQAGGRENPDFNGARQSGAGRFDATVHHGSRQSVARAYLARPPRNLTIRTGARITSVVLEGNRAVGLRMIDGDGEQVVRATCEVILSLGAFGSPQVLMLSGIGPAEQLRAHGIAVRAELAGVGQNLRDHLNMPVQFACNDPALSLARYQRIDRAVWLALRYFLTRGGPGAAPFWSTALFHPFSDPDLPDLEVFLTPMVVRETPEKGDGLWRLRNLMQIGRVLLTRGKSAMPGFQFDINQLRPQSVGEVRLASADPRAAPVIDPRFLSDPRDLADLVAGVHHMRDVAARPALAAIRGDELSPGADCRSDAEIAEAVRALATTGHHPVGTCKMGRDGDPMAVVDGQLRLRGIDGLRVADASIFPDQISGNPNAAIIAIAEKAADMILGRPAPPPEYPGAPGDAPGRRRPEDGGPCRD